MKTNKLLGLLITLAVLSAMFLMGLPQAVRATEAPLPILDFDLTQGSGTEIVDSANGIVGTTHGTLWSTDPSGMPVLYFDNSIKPSFGDGDYFEIPNHEALNSPEISLEILAYPMDCGYYTVFMERIRDGGTYQTNMLLGLVPTGYETGTKPQFALSIGGVWHRVISPEDISLNSWSHIVGTYDGSDMKIYVDEILKATEAGVGGPREMGSNPLYLGHAPSSNHYFNGYMAKFKMYDYALTAEEVAYEFDPPPVANANGPYLGMIGEEISFDGTASSDPEGEPLIYDWNWGDGTESLDAGATPTHTYSVVGIYEVCLTVTDPDGNSGTACTIAVVFDPDSGFVTGSGWILSPEGAYKPDPSITGQATFGFVAKYDKRADFPEGNTQFVFNAGDIHFHSSDYEWLVVNQNDSRAQFKGTGAINFTGEYMFMLWAVDGDPDTFRIKIWYEDNGTEFVIYDNDVAQPLGSGDIIVHTKK